MEVAEFDPAQVMKQTLKPESQALYGLFGLFYSTESIGIFAMEALVDFAHLGCGTQLMDILSGRVNFLYKCLCICGII